ncbi:hypothetical protein D3C76_1759350 [compost metagenome]
MLSNVKDQNDCQRLVLPRHNGLSCHATEHLLLLPPLPDVVVCGCAELLRNIYRTGISKQQLAVTIDY